MLYTETNNEAVLNNLDNLFFVESNEKLNIFCDILAGNFKRILLNHFSEEDFVLLYWMYGNLYITDTYITDTYITDRPIKLIEYNEQYIREEMLSYNENKYVEYKWNIVYGCNLIVKFKTKEQLLLAKMLNLSECLI